MGLKTCEKCMDSDLVEVTDHGLTFSDPNQKLTTCAQQASHPIQNCKLSGSPYQIGSAENICSVCKPGYLINNKFSQNGEEEWECIVDN